MPVCALHKSNPYVPTANNSNKYNYLAISENYTVGKGVCNACRFPIQLEEELKNYISASAKIIAQKSWTITNLKTVIATENSTFDYDVVTLLIVVNHQYQNIPIEVSQQEFPQLVSQVIAFRKGDNSNLIALSIPYYAYAAFGNGAVNISTEIDSYNTFTQNYCLENNNTFINITDISRMALQQTELVATDGLHHSEMAYSKFVASTLP
jgi:hypothetical protein